MKSNAHDPAMYLVVVLSFALLGAASCAWASSTSFNVTVNGATVGGDSETYRGDGNNGFGPAFFTGNNYHTRVEGRVYPAHAGAFAQVTSNVPAEATVTAISDSRFRLDAQPGLFTQVAGGRLVLYFILEGDITGNATLASDVSVRLLINDTESVMNAPHQSLNDQPGPDTAAFEISFPLPASLQPGVVVQASPSLTLTVSASVPGGQGGQLQTATIDANNTLRVAGFRVFDASGAQVTGFRFTPGPYIREYPPLSVGVAPAIEYYNSSYGFFFITSIAQEISDLDTGKALGWQRTGESFNVYTTSRAGLVAVCRFYGVFGAKSSHFYAPRGLGCEALLPPNHSVWQYEGDVFYSQFPDENGGCPAGNDPIFRLYNNNQDAPNHRFTTSASIQAKMIGEGWIAEGTGSGVGMCSPQQ